MSVSVHRIVVMGTVARLVNDAYNDGKVEQWEIEEECRAAVIALLKRKGVAVPPGLEHPLPRVP